MTDPEQQKLRNAGMFFIRVLLGIIFFMQGYGKIFTMGIHKVYESFFKDFENTVLPKWLIVSTAYYTSYVELIGGFLLIAGLFRKFAMYLLATGSADCFIWSWIHGTHMGFESCYSQGYFTFRIVLSCLKTGTNGMLMHF